MTHYATSSPPARLLAPDLARGVMLLLIAFANVSIYLWGQPVSGISAHPVDGSTLDNILAGLTMMFIDGRIYPMFAFLFGYGMLQFTMSRLDRGVAFPTVSRMIMRRHIWLIIFGAVHAVLLFAGDILGAYGLTGVIVASLLLRGSDRTMRILLWSVGGVVAGMLLIGAVITWALGMFMPPGLFDTDIGADADPLGIASWSTADFMSGIESWWIALFVRLGTWVVSTPATVISLVVPLCVLLGGYAGRHRWLEGGAHRIKLGTIAAIAIPIAAVSGLPNALAHVGVIELDELTGIGWTVFSQLAGIIGGIGYAALFALIGQRLSARHAGGRLPWLTRAVAAVGQRSLTFYLLQSVIFAPLLAAWGFGLGAEIGTSVAFAIAAGVWVVSVIIAALLDSAGARGPAEVLLRRLTYGRGG